VADTAGVVVVSHLHLVVLLLSVCSVAFHRSLGSLSFMVTSCFSYCFSFTYIPHFCPQNQPILSVNCGKPDILPKYRYISWKNRQYSLREDPDSGSVSVGTVRTQSFTLLLGFMLKGTYILWSNRYNRHIQWHYWGLISVMYETGIKIWNLELFFYSKNRQYCSRRTVFKNLLLLMHFRVNKWFPRSRTVCWCWQYCKQTKYSPFCWVLQSIKANMELYGLHSLRKAGTKTYMFFQEKFVFYFIPHF
jgi:hypothetical protein